LPSNLEAVEKTFISASTVIELRAYEYAAKTLGTVLTELLLFLAKSGQNVLASKRCEMLKILPKW
jgi:hypothetical protein